MIFLGIMFLTWLIGIHAQFLGSTTSRVGEHQYYVEPAAIVSGSYVLSFLHCIHI